MSCHGLLFFQVYRQIIFLLFSTILLQIICILMIFLTIIEKGIDYDVCNRVLLYFTHLCWDLRLFEIRVVFLELDGYGVLLMILSSIFCSPKVFSLSSLRT